MQDALTGEGALHQLARIDADIANAITAHGPPPTAPRRTGLPPSPGSSSASRSNQGRGRCLGENVRRRMGDQSLSPARQRLMSCCRQAFSPQGRAQGLATAIEDGHLDLDALPHLDGEEASRRFVALRGSAPAADNYRFCPARYGCLAVQ